MKRILCVLLSVLLLCTALSAGFTVSADETPNYIDNSALTPKYVEDDLVELEDSGDGLYSPDWVKHLIIAELHIGHATPEGTFEAAIELLDHYQEAGVNGVWLCPIYDDNDDSNYGNFGIHTISKAFTGCDNYEDGFAVFKNFVDEAHKRNIRVFLDTVLWGCDWEAPMYNEGGEDFPASWFAGEDYWGGWSYNWSNPDFYEYFVSTSVWWTTEMGIDGFRCDLEPGVTGYNMWKEVRTRALEAGEKIAIFSETTNERMNGCYDFDEHSAGNDMWQMYELFTELYDLMDYVKEGEGISTNYYQLTGEAGYARFYSYGMSCHDSERYGMQGSVAMTAYQALFTPFIPIFFMGEEVALEGPSSAKANLYATIRYDHKKALEDPEKREFFENFKHMIRIRRTYADLLTDFPKFIRDTKIEEVETVGLETVNGYIRYNDDYGIIVVPNNNQHMDDPFICRIPYVEMGWENATYELTDLWTNEVVATGSHRTLYDFEADVPYDFAGIYLIKRVGTTTDEELYGTKDNGNKAAADAPAAEAGAPAAEADTPTAEADTPDAEADAPAAEADAPAAEADTPDTEADTPDAEADAPDAEADTPTADDVADGKAEAPATDDAASDEAEVLTTGDAAADVESGDDAADNSTWIYVLIGVVVVLAAACGIIFVRKRRA